MTRMAALAKTQNHLWTAQLRHRLWTDDHPFPFKFRIVPRSEKHLKLIKKLEMEHPWQEGDAKLLKGLSG